MSRVYLEFDKKHNKWNEVEESPFWIDYKLKVKLDALKMIQEKNWDGVIVIDGKERSGKSILGMICGWYLANCKLTINNFARGLDDAAKKIASLPDGSVLIMDEGSTVFGSKDSTTKAQKQLVKIMDVVGQKNLIFIICMPCFFDLNKTIAVRRSLFLCHVYPDKKYNRGNYAFFGETRKKHLYKFGKANFDSYAFPEAEFVGEYFNFKPEFYAEYLEQVKKESLDAVLKDAIGEKVDVDAAIRECEAKFYWYLKEKMKWKYKDLKKILNSSATTIKERVYAHKDRLEEEKS